MVSVMKFMVSSGLAFAMQQFLDWVLPADMTRVWVIVWAGVACVVWSAVHNAIWGLELIKRPDQHD